MGFRCWFGYFPWIFLLSLAGACQCCAGGAQSRVWAQGVGLVAWAASPAQKRLEGWAGDTMELQPPTSLAWKSSFQCSWGEEGLQEVPVCILMGLSGKPGWKCCRDGFDVLQLQIAAQRGSVLRIPWKVFLHRCSLRFSS